MLVSEDVLREGFALLPEVTYTSTENRKPFFDWGTKEEMDRRILNKKSDCYPLIWLLPSKDVYNRQNGHITKKVELIVSTLEVKTELFNEQRWKRTYLQVLNPLLENIEYYLNNASNVLLTSDLTVYKFPNSESATDKWDAMRLSFDIEINNNCLKPIIWT